MTSTNAPDKEFDFEEKDFQRISRIVYETAGIVLRKEKKPMVYARLARRLRKLNFDTFKAYCDYIEKGDDTAEFENFINAITTNLTNFFRENHHFTHLQQFVLPKYIENLHTEKRFRIWSAACSSGEEPYSTAMIVKETLPSHFRGDLKILGTDIDTNMVQKASTGKYREKGTIPSKFHQYLTNQDDEFEIKSEIKNFITFKQLNLLHTWPFSGPFDVVFCRNVIIYFDKPTQKQLFEKMAAVMRPGGILYIGHSESLHNLTDKFRLIGQTIYQRIEEGNS